MLELRKACLLLIMILAGLLVCGCGDDDDLEGAGPPGKATNPQPADKARAVSITTDLAWEQGEFAYDFHLYLGTDLAAVEDANPSSAEFVGSTKRFFSGPPYDLDYSTTYYWRIDSINAAGVAHGHVWRFTTLPAPPVVGFTVMPATGTAPLEVMFTNTSTGQIRSCLWDFGDGDTSTEQNPTHTYTAEGTYTVSLTVTGPGGNVTWSRMGCIEILLAAPPVADFTATPTSGAAPLEVTFTDASTGQIHFYLWDFGDGESGTEQNPSHTYTAEGTYAVSLTVTGPGGEDTQTRTACIQVSVAPPSVPANFSGEARATNQIEWTWADVPGASAYLLEDADSEPLALVASGEEQYAESELGENTAVIRRLRSCTTNLTEVSFTSPGTATGARLPWSDLTTGYRAQYLYTAAELSNTAGIIRKIYWHRTNSGGAETYESVSVTLGHTTRTWFRADYASNFDVDGSTLVRDAAAYEVPAASAAGEWVEIPLERAFYYNGMDNLVIDIDVVSGTANLDWSNVDVTGGSLEGCTSMYGSSGEDTGMPWHRKFFVKLGIEAVDCVSDPANAAAYTLVHDATTDDFDLSLGWPPTEVVVTVAEPPNPYAGYTGVRIERAADSGFTTGIVTVQDFTDNYLYTDTSVSTSTTYWYRITYCNGDGFESAPSPPSSITVP